MLVEMLKTEKGVHDGEIHPVEFKAGEIYDIGPDLHRAFKGIGIIKDVELKEIPSQAQDSESNPIEPVTEKESPEQYETKVIEPKETKEYDVELTRDQIKVSLDALGVEYDGRAKTETLEALLKENTKESEN